MMPSFQTSLLAVGFLLIVSLSSIVNGQNLGQRCENNSTCNSSGKGMICVMPLTQCSYGACECPSDMAFDYQQGKCLPKSWLLLSCGNSTTANKTCVDKNSECVKGYCACSTGYVEAFPTKFSILIHFFSFVLGRTPDKLFWMCRKENATGVYGDTCVTDSYCKEPFQCINMKCVCKSSETYTGIGKRLCAPSKSY